MNCFERTVCAILLAALAPATADACIVRIRGDVVLRGTRISPLPSCSNCGTRIVADEVLQGEEQVIYQLEGRGTAASCYPTSKRDGQKGIFELKKIGDKYFELSFSERPGK